MTTFSCAFTALRTIAMRTSPQNNSSRPVIEDGGSLFTRRSAKDLFGFESSAFRSPLRLHSASTPPPLRLHSPTRLTFVQHTGQYTGRCIAAVYLWSPGAAHLASCLLYPRAHFFSTLARSIVRRCVGHALSSGSLSPLALSSRSLLSLSPLALSFRSPSAAWVT
jgi:hypothetical protein